MPDSRSNPVRSSRRGLWPLALVLSIGAQSTALAVNDVAGTLKMLTGSSTAPNGAWSWFEDERAIIDDSDPHNTLLLVGSVSFGGEQVAEHGDIDLLWLNVDNGAHGEFELHDQFQSDDHDSAALLRRPDGRYLAMYAPHGGGESHWRVSTNPHDPTSWSPTQPFDFGGGVTYSNLHHLPNDNGGAGRTYNFHRRGATPSIMISSDLGENWSYGGILEQYADRPYVRYFSDDERIHLITTEGHPRVTNNSVYHGYVQDGVLYDSFGTVKDPMLFDTSPISPTDLTPIFATGTPFGGVPMTHAWTTDVAIDSLGRPVAVFTARANGDVEDHRFFYASFDGSEWDVHEIAKAGGYLYSMAEGDYTGLASMVPDDPDTLYISTDIDPITDQQLEHYEIYRGTTADGGASWDWDPITWNSTMDNLRPLVPKWNTSETALVWMRGTYFSWTSWNTQVVALTFSDPVLAGDYNGNGVVDEGDYTIWRDTLGQVGMNLPADGNDSGDVDAGDYDVWKAGFGNTQGAGTGGGGLAHLASGDSPGAKYAVPEPGTLFLLASCILPRRRR